MSNLITEIYDKQAVVDNLNQLGELINSSLNAIVASAPKLQNPIEYLTAVQSISEIEKKNTEVTQAKAKAMSDLDKAYQQADKALQQAINLQDEEYQEQVKLTSSYKELSKEQKQLIEIERTRQQTLQYSDKLLKMEAKSEGELRMQQQQLIKAQQSLRVTNEQENALRTQIIQKINANKEALRQMSDEVSKQRDNVGNYKSVWDAFTEGQVNLKQAMKLVRDEMGALEGQMAAGNKLTAEQQKRYNDLNIAMGNLTDIQGDMSARAKVLSDDYRKMTFALESVKLGVNVMTSLQSVTALLGDDNEELQKAMAKVVATQQILNTVGEIQKQLNKDSSIMVNLRLIKEKLLTKEIEGQTRAQLALNAAKLGLVTAAIAVVGAIGTLIYKYASAKNEVAEFSKEINKQATDAVAPTIAKVEILKAKWDALGGSLEKQKKFLTDNKTELEGIGVALNNVSEAEKFFSEQTKNFIKAQVLRAQAEAARSKIEELAKERLDARLEYERKYIHNQRTFMEELADYSLKIQTHGANITQARREAYEKQEQQFDQEMKSLIMLSGTLDEQSKAIIEGLGLKSESIKETENQTQANKEQKLSLEELAKQEEEWAKTQLNDIFKNTTKNLTEQTDATAKLIDEKKKLVDEAINSIEIEEEEAEKIETLSEMTKRLAKEQEEMLKKRKEAVQDAKENLTEAFETITQSQLDNLERQSDAYDEDYERRRQAIENTVMSEEEKDRRLKALDNEKTAHDRQIARQRAEIERKQAIFNNAIKSAEAMSNAVASVGKLLETSAGGDTYTAVARYIAAISAGITAVTTISSLISQLIKIPAFKKGGTAEANKPFIAGEKGREIGFGVYSGKVYDFSKPTLFKANEPINIKNAAETRQIINNNEYNKDVTLHNEISVQVIDNTRINKFFKIW